ncbi:ASCH_ASC-1 domain containing protein [Burkholderia phage CSP3]|nr:ASCH_ASC-1 domain containing protein [Burkholderia phage CSP3]
MKALSIRQPWAWLVAAGHKDIENRTWRTSYRGPLLIHASKGMTIAEYVDVRGFLRLIGREDIEMPHPKELERGGIIGVADLMAVVPPAGRTSPWHMEGCYGLYLRNARPLPFIPYTGRLGIFDVPDRVLKVAA